MFKKQEIIISIIIPVYNVEKYIKNCINSIINQNIEGIEIILVNDGSSDISGTICKKYSDKFENIVYIEQENKGPSAARNIGIKQARGKYIGFIDSDDMLEHNFISKINEEINNYKNDLLMWGIKFEWVLNDNTAIIQHINYENNKYNLNEFTDKLGLYLDNYYFNFVWNKLYKKNIILDNNLFFDETMKIGEDLMFNLEYIKYCKSIKIIEDILYKHTNINKTSLTQSYNKEHYQNERKVYISLKNTLKELGKYNDFNKKIIDEYYINMTFLIMSYTINGNYGLNYNEKRSIIKCIIRDEVFISTISNNINNKTKNKILYYSTKLNSFLMIYILCKSIRIYQKLIKKLRS